MPPTSRRRLVLFLTVAVQLPALLLVAIVTRGWGALLALPAAALTASFVVALNGPYAIQPRSRVHLYWGLWPFFAWWAACLAFIPVAALTLPLGWLLGLTAQQSTQIAAAIAILVGLQAINRTPRVVELTLPFPDLPAALDGFRIAQISDIHCGAFAPEARVAAWARQTTALGADLIAVTGDLIVRGDEYVDAVARALGELSAPDGVFVAMGNHDYWGGGERLVLALEHEDLIVPRNAARTIQRGDATLLVAAVDDTWSGRAHLPQTLAGPPTDAFTLLLAHDPELFDEAARLGARLTLSGHTHGGQLGVPFFTQRWNMARIAHHYSLGLYHRDGAALYVNAGIGTSGPPIRIGVRAEITLITLRRATAGRA